MRMNGWINDNERVNKKFQWMYEIKLREKENMWKLYE